MRILPLLLLVLMLAGCGGSQKNQTRETERLWKERGYSDAEVAKGLRISSETYRLCAPGDIALVDVGRMLLEIKSNFNLGMVELEGLPSELVHLSRKCPGATGAQLLSGLAMNGGNRFTPVQCLSMLALICSETHCDGQTAGSTLAEIQDRVTTESIRQELETRYGVKQTSDSFEYMGNIAISSLNLPQKERQDLFDLIAGPNAVRVGLLLTHWVKVCGLTVVALD